MGWFDKLRQKPKADNHEEVQTRLVPGVGRMPYPAYRGKEPYVFVSYAHLDSAKVFNEGRNVEFGSGFPVFTCPLATIYCYRDSLTYDDLTDFSNSNIPIRFIGEDLDLASIKAKEPKVQTRMIWQ